MQAYILNSSIAATGSLALTATSNQTIDANVLAGSAAIAGGGAFGGALSGAGASTTNDIASKVRAYIDGDGASGISASSVTLTAHDTSTISATAGAASLAASFAGGVGISASVGVALARNTIGNVVEAAIKNADNTVTTTSGAVTLDALEAANITATSAAASLAASVGGAAGIAISGAGAESTNVILNQTTAHIDASKIASAASVVLTAADTSAILAQVVAASASVAVGGTAGIGASIGASRSRNLIGRRLDGTLQQAQVQAYVSNSSITAGGDLTQTATARETINATVLSGSVAAAGGTVGVAASGAGSDTENSVATLIRAYIDGDGATGILANNISLKADDASTITATAGSASMAAAFGAVGVAVSVGLGLANNEISNVVESYIKNADGDSASNSDSGVRTTVPYASSVVSAALKQGDRVRAAGNYAVANFNTTATASLDNTKSVKMPVGSLCSSPRTSRTAQGAIQVKQGDFVRLASGYAGGGTAGAIYKFVGTNPTAAIDLGTQNYGTSDWQLVNGEADSTYVYLGAGGTVDLKAQNFSNTALWKKVSAVAGGTYQFVGTAGTRDLSVENYGDTAIWQPVTPGDINIEAVERATVTATAVAASAALGGGIVGLSFSGAGADAKNVILTKTHAYVDGSDLSSERHAILSATDTAIITAEVLSLSAAVSGGLVAGAVSVGSSTANNLIGYTLAGRANAGRSAGLCAAIRASSPVIR